MIRRAAHTVIRVARAVTAPAAATGDGAVMTLPTYDSHPTWRRYQPYFPEGMRCTPASTPSESYWRWRDLDVHLDRLDVAASPIKVIVLHGAGAYGRVMAPASVIARR